MTPSTTTWLLSPPPNMTAQEEEVVLAGGKGGGGGGSEDEDDGGGSALRVMLLKLFASLVLVLVSVFANAVVLVALRRHRLHHQQQKDGSPPTKGSVSHQHHHHQPLYCRRPNPVTLVQVLACVSIVNGVVVVSFQSSSILYGEWVFGYPLCQFQGFTVSLLDFCVVWYLALLSFERYTHRLQPQEYSLTLSHLNLNVIMIGVFFLLLTAVSGPIYGWGEYTYSPDLGLCSLNTDPNTSANIVTYLALSLTVYVLLPYSASALWYTLLLVRPEPTHAHDETNLQGAARIFASRSTIYVFATASLLSLLLGLPFYVAGILQCCLYRVDGLLVYVFFCLHSFALHTCTALCCVVGCGQLRVRISRLIVCSLKTKCRHLQEEERTRIVGTLESGSSR